ncbi:MAG: MFS transporter [Deltaproteobacteria bacterium]|nr:MFS transporter [Deltaproteobacteria bacterium]
MDNKFQAKGFLVWGICALFFLYEFFLRTVIGTYQHPVMQDLDITSFQFSVLSTTTFALILGTAQIPLGFIVSNIGLKKSLATGSLICAIASIGFAYSYNYPMAVFYRMLMALGASFGFICLLVSVYDWMPHRYSAVFIGLSQFIGTLGPMISAGPLETMSESQSINWRFVFLTLSGIGFALFVLVFLFVDNNQEKSGRNIILQKPEKLINSLKRLFTNRQAIYIALVTGGLYFAIEYLSANEGRSFLLLKGVSLQSASYMITISWIGYAIGCPLLGALSDIFERRKALLSLSGVLGLLSIISILYLPGEITLFVAFFMLGISAAGQSIGYANIAEQFNKQFTAIAFGFNNAVVAIIAAINAPTIGLLIDRSKQAGAISLGDYRFVFSILVITILAALLISVFLLKETYCKSAAEFTVLKLK